FFAARAGTPDQRARRARRRTLARRRPRGGRRTVPRGGDGSATGYVRQALRRGRLATPGEPLRARRTRRGHGACARGRKSRGGQRAASPLRRIVLPRRRAAGRGGARRRKRARLAARPGGGPPDARHSLSLLASTRRRGL